MKSGDRVESKKTALEAEKAACLKLIDNYLKSHKKKQVIGSLRNKLADDPYFKKCVLGDATIQHTDFKDIFDAGLTQNQIFSTFLYAMMLSPLFLNQVQHFSAEQKIALKEKLKTVYNNRKNKSPYHL